MKNVAVRVHLDNGLIAAGTGEVLFEPSDGAVYVMGNDGAHTVFNFDHITHYVVVPIDDEKEEEGFRIG
ncbi:hypothetical protein M614_gp45 [Mycobacterium phage BTCU-1]|uniref:Uncharacterized protein n=1 Tax=Mycobacterium phage BTCU-1 TaxID=1262532 RepID=R9R4M1_9CAUD|nr:hypothetical protein M614_gp45 [Mycobacterium phage BTCU-1]AGI61726.1 hypothetical protein CKC_45 [Mycobacterium phage BTCU-1]